MREDEHFLKGYRIPQHRLISKSEWDRLRKKEISKFSYYACTGDHMSQIHDFRVTVTRDDIP